MDMTAQMRAFLDSTGGLWQSGALVGLPYAFGGQRIDEISGGSPYGAWTITGGKVRECPATPIAAKLARKD